VDSVQQRSDDLDHAERQDCRHGKKACAGTSHPAVTLGTTSNNQQRAERLKLQHRTEALMLSGS